MESNCMRVIKNGTFFVPSAGTNLRQHAWGHRGSWKQGCPCRWELLANTMPPQPLACPTHCHHTCEWQDACDLGAGICAR